MTSVLEVGNLHVSYGQVLRYRLLGVGTLVLSDDP